MESEIARLPDGWDFVRLGDLVGIKHGYPFVGDSISGDLTGKPIVVNIGNFDYSGGFRFESTTVREYRGGYPPEYELTPGEILLVMTCQTPGGEILGIPARVPNDGKTYLHNQRLGKVVIKCPERINPDYLYWVFLTKDFNRELCCSATGTKILHTSPGRIESALIAVPPMKYQESVAGILGAIDSKIQLLRQANAALEAIAQAIFRSWFVDFDPVRDKAEGRDPVAVPSEVAELFPSEFEDSDLGSIPKGWRSGRLDDYSELNPESWTKKAHPSTLLYVDLANTKDNRIEAVTEYKFEDAPSRARRVLRSGDTIVGTVRPGNRSFAFVLNPPPHLTGSTGFAVLRPRRKSLAELVFIAATRKESLDILAHLADGGAYPAVRPEIVKNLPVVVAPSPIIEAFHEIVGPLLQRVSLNDIQVSSLADLRDILLPRLMSGKLNIPCNSAINLGEV